MNRRYKTITSQLVYNNYYIYVISNTEIAEVIKSGARQFMRNILLSKYIEDIVQSMHGGAPQCGQTIRFSPESKVDFRRTSEFNEEIHKKGNKSK